MTTSRPRVSIAVPVYNGERYLEESLRSILGQTYEDLELIVCDNASTDRTEKLCRDWAARDRRVRYHRSETNRGASWNFNRGHDLATGELFRWQSDDDRIAPTYLEQAVAVLDADRSVVVCHSQITLIGPQGETIGEFDYPADHAASAEPAHRFRDLLRQDRWCFEVFGLTRTAALARTRLIGPYVGSDRVVRAELGLLGRFHILPERLFFNRDHAGRSVRALPAHHLRAAWFNPERAGRVVLPHWRLLGEYLRCIRRAGLPAGQQLACFAALGGWLGLHMNWARLGADLVIAAVPSSWSLLFRRSGAGEEWLGGARSSGRPVQGDRNR